MVLKTRAFYVFLRHFLELLTFPFYFYAIVYILTFDRYFLFPS